MKTRLLSLLSIMFCLAAASCLTGCYELQALRQQNDSLKLVVKDLEEKNLEYYNRYNTLFMQKEKLESDAEQAVQRLQLERDAALKQRSEAERGLESRNRELAQQLEAAQRTNNQLRSAQNTEIETRDNTISDLNLRLTTATREKTKVQNDASTFKRERDEFEGDAVRYQGEVSELQTELEQARGQGVEVETLRQQLLEARSELSGKDDAVNTRDEELAQLRTNEATLQETVSDREETIAERDKTINTLSEELQTVEANVEKVEGEKTQLNQQLVELQRRMEALPEQEWQKRLTAKQTEVDNLQKDLDSQKELTGAEQAKNGELQKDVEKLKAEKDEIANAAKESPAEKDQNLKEAETLLKQVLKAQIEAKLFKVSRDDRGLVVTVGCDDLFQPSTVVLNSAIKEPLKNLAQSLAKYPDNAISVEGHTDNQTVINLPFRDNLALSSQRASNVAYIMYEDGVLKQLVSITGYGESMPVANNRTLPNRKQNRRVEIILKPVEK